METREITQHIVDGIPTLGFDEVGEGLPVVFPLGTGGTGLVGRISSWRLPACALAFFGMRGAMVLSTTTKVH
jgi:hypothetical protein